MRTANGSIGIAFLSVLACTSDVDRGFTLLKADPATWIEGTHEEPGHVFVLRAHLEGASVVSTISEGDKVLTTLAGSPTSRASEARWLQSQATSGQGASALSTTDLESLSKVYDRALGRLLSAVSPELRKTPLVAHLARHRQLVRALLAGRRRALLQEWGTEASRSLRLQPDERTQLASILRRYAEGLERPAGPETRVSTQQEIARLLGPSRWERYQERRSEWLATRDPGAHTVAP